MSEIKSRLLDAVKVAMRAQDKPRLTTLRLALADIKRVEVDERIVADDVPSLILLSVPTSPGVLSYALFCLNA
ncbi:GatB/YqeY domain-containing protein, partial [Escherichia coli]|nr:GatB/YqeY domain-containing protein [Escherichia coli]